MAYESEPTIKTPPATNSTRRFIGHSYFQNSSHEAGAPKNAPVMNITLRISLNTFYGLQIPLRDVLCPLGYEGIKRFIQYVCRPVVINPTDNPTARLHH